MQSALESGDRVALDAAVQLDVALHALMFTLSGVPVLYSGDEIAMLNDESYHDDPMKAEDSRYLHRGDMDWAAAEKRGDETTPQGRVFQAVKRLEGLRRDHVAFDSAAEVHLVPGLPDSLLGIERVIGGERLIAVFNFAEFAQAALPGDTARYRDLWTDKSASAETITVPAGGFRWLLQE